MSNEEEREAIKKGPCPVEYGLIYRTSDHKTLLSKAIGPGTYDKEVKKVLKVLKSKNLQPSERQKIISKKFDGNWCAQCDDQNVIHLFLIKHSYPDYLVGQLINESIDQILRIPLYWDKTPKELKKDHYQQFKEILYKYNQPEKNDNLSKIGMKVEVAKGKMKENIEDALKNQMDLEVSFT